MKTASHVFVAVALALAVVGCQSRKVEETPATQPRSAGARERPSMDAVVAANTVALLDQPYVQPLVREQTLDIYRPKDAKAATTVVYIHGGEWARGDKSEVAYKPKFLNEHGIIFISLNYRLSGTDKHPAQVNDIATGLRWVRDHIAEYGGDPHKILLVGHSAGCHLVTFVGLDPRPLATVGMKPADLLGVVSWSGGAFDLVDKEHSGGMYQGYIHKNFGDSQDDWRDASPSTHVGESKPIPPFLFISAGKGNAGSIVAAKTLADKIIAAGGKATNFTLDDKDHFGADHDLGVPGDESGQLLLDFIRHAQGS